MIDFEIPEETKQIREKVRRFVQQECIPTEQELTADNYEDVLAGLRVKARAEGLWMPFFPKEWGGMGLKPLANALVQMELGHSKLGALSLNTQGPDDATMMMLLNYGTEYQQEEFLKPMVAGDYRVCYAMTEKSGGADATGMKTTAVEDGDNYILNGDKWYITSAHCASVAVVMAKTDPDAPRHQQFSTFIVKIPSKGFDIIRDIETMQHHGELSQKMGATHSEIHLNNLVVPKENLLGGRGNGFGMGQHRLGYGRLRHGMHNIIMAQKALDMAAAYVLERETFGQKLSERQGVQFMLADCAAEIYKARLMLLHIAYKAEMGQDMRQENAIAKNFLAHMVHKVVDTSLQLHGSLGFSRDTVLADWYISVRQQRLVDGPDEVHKWTIGRNVLKAFQKDGTTAAAAGGDLL